jgi:hypothetical protein
MTDKPDDDDEWLYDDEWVTPKILSLRSGTNFKAEDEADRLLAEGRRGVTSMTDKTDYLSHEQLALRRAKEVFNVNGVSDSSLYHGLYRRAYNPMAGQRPRGNKSSEE